MTGDLISPEMARTVCDHFIHEDSLVKMLNPLSAEQSVLRPSLLPGLLDVLRRNIAHRILDLSMFEVGSAHLKKQEEYLEPRIFSLLLTGKANLPHFSEPLREGDFFDLKGIIENLFLALRYHGVEVKKSDLSIFHPGRQAKIFVQGLHIGMMGELHPQLLGSLDIQQRVLFAECDFQELMRLERKETKMQELPVFPSSERDWTVTVSKSATFGEIKAKIEACKPSILESTKLVAIYENEKLGYARHNVSLRFVYRDHEKTVSQEEVEKAHLDLVGQLIHYLAEKYPE
jgi:phenylalanyl-tRNA synthetase beta chain